MDGFEVLRAIRKKSNVPVIMLTARGDEIDQVRGLEAGADDYVSKPFGHLALMARVNAVLRRRASASPTAHGGPDIVLGPLAIDSTDHQLIVNGGSVRLTPLEFNLLVQLAGQQGRLQRHEVLIERVWGSDVFATPNHLKVVASRLRAKLVKATGHDWIRAERGIGYRLVIPAALVASTSDQ
jgi:DNA-binding response OmpR family regulator